MISEVQSFLQSIIDEPEDNGLRLIFADWLEENGSTLGEFIRLQIELSGMSAWDPRRPLLESREVELLRRHGSDWHPESPDLNSAAMASFRRGFPDVVTITDGSWPKVVADLWEWTPLREIRICSRDPQQLAQLADWPFLERARILTMGQATSSLVDVGSLVPLLQSPYLSEVRDLSLVPLRLSQAELQAFLESYFVGQLTSLRLSSLTHDPDVLATLFHSPRLAQLRHFGPVSRFDDGQIQTLAQCQYWDNLTSLSLADSRVSADTMHSLLDGPLLRKLTDLNLRAHEITDSTLGGLFETDFPSTLEVLDVSNGVLHSGAMRAFAQWPAGPKLKTLNLANTTLPP